MGNPHEHRSARHRRALLGRDLHLDDAPRAGYQNLRHAAPGTRPQRLMGARLFLLRQRDDPGETWVCLLALA